MKKLLVAAIGAAAAYGASAGLISTQRFESAVGELPLSRTVSQLNELAGGTYWSGDDLTNKYSIVSAQGEDFPQDKPLGTPTKALAIETAFNSPLQLDAIATGTPTNIPASGIYFDSLVKFTVCDGAPEQEYSGAKVIMWLQEMYEEDGETVKGTNLMVRAGYLATDNTCTPSNFVCRSFTEDVDDWHRVTIKTLPTIVNGATVPGFVIFINESAINIADGYSMQEGVSLTDAAYSFGRTKVFPSLDQGNSSTKSTISAVSFAGKGSLTDLVFTDVAPDFAKDLDPVEVSSVVVDDVAQDTTVVRTLADAVSAANGATKSAKITLARAVAIDDDALEFTANATITLDFAGFVLTNELDGAAITNSAAALIVTDSVGTGGIVCGDEIPAIYQSATSADAISVTGGNFWAAPAVKLDENYTGTTKFISGGAFASDVGDDAEHLVDGKAFGAASEETDLYPVVNYVPPAPTTHTVTVELPGLGSHVNVAVVVNGEPVDPEDSYEVEEGGSVTVTYTADVGYVLTSGTAEYVFTNIDKDEETTAPTATAATYGITYYNGETPLDLAPATYTYGEGVAVLPSASAATGYQFDGWYDNAGLTGDPVASIATTATGAKTLYAKFSGKTFTIYTCTNGVENTSKEFTYAGASVAPADPTFNSETEEWDGKWYISNVSSTEFAFDPAGEATQFAYATITAKSGGGDWDPDPSKIDESKTAAQEYPALADTPLASANAKKLTVWAKANSVSLSDAESATTPLVESYLLNCAPADLETEKAAFKLDISFDGSGNPVVTLPVGKEYNVTPTMKGSNDLSTWKVIDSTTGYQFFKYELSL